MTCDFHNKFNLLILDFRRKRDADLAPLFINGPCVERVTFKFMGVLKSKDISWSANTTATVKRAETPLP